jgi:FOG: EAL domain
MNKLRFNINVSHVQLQHKKFPEIIENTLMHYHIEPKILMLEISCDELTLDDIAIQNIERLKIFGISIAWDNISSEKQLQSLHSFFKPHAIKLKPGKIDEKKINEINKIIDFAENNKIEVIAEQLETMRQTSVFLRRNVMKGQGYIFSRAIDLTEFKKRYINIQ